MTTLDRAYQRVAWRVMPLLFLCYVFNYIDRVNIGIASLDFKRDLGISDAAYGFGAGLFFVGFVLFELPSNLILARVGARLTLLRIMVLWGLVSAGTMFVSSAPQFYGARLLLGAAEAGFFPGIILYLTYWFPASRRARVTSWFLLAIPIAGILGSPLSGWIMQRFDGVNGWQGWQWLLLLEGLPSAVLGVVAYLALDDGPGSAAWLSAEERTAIADDLARERPAAAGSHGALAALRDPRVYIAGTVSFSSYLLANTIAFWTPAVIRAGGVESTVAVGVLTAVPFAAGAAGMLSIGALSDRRMERRWHTAIPLFFGGLSLAVLPLVSSNAALAVLLLSTAAFGHYAALTVFWTIPSTYLAPSSAASGIALVSTIGAAGGAVAPTLLGWARTTTGDLTLGLQIVATLIMIGSVVLLVGIPAHLLPRGPRR